MSDQLDGQVAAQHQPAVETGQGHRAYCGDAIDRQADMHGPIGPLFAVFARAVDRIDNPHAGFIQALFGVLAFFRQQPVLGMSGAQGMDKELVGDLIACLSERLAFEHSAGAHLQQDASGTLGEVGGQLGVGHFGRPHRGAASL